MSPPGEPPTLIHRPRSVIERLAWSDLFPQAQPVELELGSGDGSFLVEHARQHPARNFLGVERLLGRLRKLDRKARRAGLVNLRLIRLEAGYLVEYLLPAASVTAIHLYFPDPWPKRRHESHRLVNETFVEAVSRALVPGGILHLRTDDAEYLAHMQALFGRHPAFQPAATPADLLALETDFERDFRAQGKPIHHTAYQHR